MLKTLKSKFVVTLVIFIMASVGIPTAFLMYQFRENFTQRSTVMLQTTMDIIRGCISHEMLDGNKNIQDIILRFSKNHGIEHIRILDKEGQIRFSTHPDEIGINVKTTSPHHIDWDRLARGKSSVLIEAKKYAVTEPMLNQPDCHRCHTQKDIIAYVDVDTQLTNAEKYFYTGSLHIIFLAIAITILLFFGFYIVFNRFIDRPMKTFIVALKNVEEGHLTTRLQVNKEDEFGILYRHFNDMAARLQDSRAKIEELHFEQLRHADKLVTIGELTAEIAHEINNPIAIIMSRADYLNMEFQDQSGLTPYQNDLQVIINQLTKVSKITGSILKYSKKLPMNFTPVNLQSIADESLNVLGPRIKKKNISLKRDYHCENTTVMGDATQIEQVFTNIINNAIDSMEENGELCVSIHCADNRKVSVEIADTGSGIDPVIRDNIFSPFFTTKAADKGTGLGLYIVKNICKNHGAEIIIGNNNGKGTVFSLIFPGYKQDS